MRGGAELRAQLESFGEQVDKHRLSDVALVVSLLSEVGGQVNTHVVHLLDHRVADRDRVARRVGLASFGSACGLKVV